MNPYTLCYYSATATEIPSLSQGINAYLSNGGKIKVLAKTRSQLFDEARIDAFVTAAMASDVILITLHGGKASCPAFDRLAEKIKESKRNGTKVPYVHIQPSGNDEEAFDLAEEFSDGFENGQWKTLVNYWVNGGSVNLRYMLLYLHNLLFDETTISCEPPRKLPHEGIYHPDVPGIPELDDYLARHVDPDKITVGMWFNQMYWVNDNLTYIDAMIREIERRGANAIPVFHLRYKDAMRGNNGSDYIVKNFFMKNGQPLIDVLLNPVMFSMTLVSPEYHNLLSTLNVPFLQAMTTMHPYAVWKDSVQGMGTMEVSFSAAQPEFDGALISVPVAAREEQAVDPITGALLAKYEPIQDRVEKLISLALNWGNLRKKANHEKRIAVVFHHYPPRNDRIGCAAGLDSFASVKNILDLMKEKGYRIDRTYESGAELAEEMLRRMTCDQRWLTPDRMAERAEAAAGAEDFTPWHEALPAAIREKMTSDWGKMPGDLFVHEETLLFPGTINGNLFITIQPPRGYLENIDKIYHDMYLSPPHHYLSHYRWIKHVFKADAVMHVGKHGSLEWLPGKALGLSEECYPDLSIMDLPNVYPFIINDPNEGTQAKRRSYCCIIDHLTPAFTNADLYEDMAKVDNLLKDYTDAKQQDPAKLDILRPMIWEEVVTADLDKDLEITEAEALGDFDEFLEQLHAYLSDLSDTMINDGLHVLGVAPEGDRLVDFLVQLTRLSNGDVPSLRESIIAAFGYDLDDLTANKGKCLERYGNRTGAQIIQDAHQEAMAMVGQLAAGGFQPEMAPVIAKTQMGMQSSEIMQALQYITDHLYPNICRVTDELQSSLNAFNGEFICPGPSGAPTRGQADILPTGRNFYSVDPNKIPTPAAWEVGKRLGDALLERYLEETGKYPESIGMILFGGGTMRSKGDSLAEILYLMGVKPIWKKGSGNVGGIEVIPSRELKRPRMDVAPRISGFFRDAFPNLVELIDQAVRTVAMLKEPPEINMVRRNVFKDIDTYRQEGLSEDAAFREATFRVFGCPPGTYGAGVEELIESKNWESQDDLGNNYIRYTAHAYGKGSYGKQKPDNFRKVLSRMDLTVKNEDSREYDMFSCTDFYNYYGGLIVAAKTVRGSLPVSMVGDSSDPRRIRIRSTFEEAKHIFRSRLLNPKWLSGMKRHGYKGAGDISKVMDIVLGWDATAEVVEDWMYERLAQRYALDPEMVEWLKEVNPYALQNILDKLLEAISRGMWQADDEMTQALQEAYLEIEGDIEEVSDR